MWVVLILLLAAGLRIYGVYQISPPGLEHDEVANWLIDRAILDGNHTIYFAEAYGHEAGFHYLQALSVALLGDHALALRLPAVLSGLLLVAIQYALTRRLFGVAVALISTAFLAVLFWPVFYSRLGLRAMLLPVISGVSLYCWWQAWSPGGAGKIRNSASILGLYSQKSSFWFALAGVLSGLTLYTYMAARSLPIFYAALLLYLGLFHKPVFKQKWRGILLFALLFVVVAAPLVFYLQTNPSAEFRVTEIDAPLRALLAGNLQPAVQNGFKILGMFGFSGDPLWRQNVAGRPVFDPLLAIAFYAGVFLALLRWRDARYAFLLLWLGSSAIPSIVTVDAPSSIRLINALLVVTVFPALIIQNIPSFSTVVPWLSTKLVYLLALLLILTHIWWTAVDVFHTWPENEEVQFVWQAALADTAVFLDQASETGPVALGGWSPATLDPPTMLLSMRRRDLGMRFFGSDSIAAPISTLIIPRAGDENLLRITRPVIREVAPELEGQLTAWGGVPQSKGSFVLYELPAPLQIEPQVPMNFTFDHQLQFLGYSFSGGQESCVFKECRLLTYWQVVAPAGDARRFFLHAVDEAGNVVAQHDGLDAPSQYWQAGDVLVQAHSLKLDTAVPMELRLGVYEPQTGRRLALANGDDHILLSLP
jgi:4-amino-4-deoxy-L-arabinose transferase-like glycosyltransferase